jgi:hypothetical protein
MGCENIIKALFYIRDTIKIYHWQTKSFARHKATCDLLASLEPLIDDFVETYMGCYERPDFGGKGFKIAIEELSDSDDSAPKIITSVIDYLKGDFNKYVKPTDTDLLNIRDEMLGVLNKTLYLFTLD